MSDSNLRPAACCSKKSCPRCAHWSFIMRRGLRCASPTLRAARTVGAVLQRGEALERYNMADTLKAQHTAYLTQGHVCYSDMGRVLMSIIDDSCGWHDTLLRRLRCRAGDDAVRRARYQEHRNDFYRNGREAVPDRARRNGAWAGATWWPTSISSPRVTADDTGSMQFHAGNSAARQPRRPARRDGHAGGAEHLPASARPGAGMAAAARRRSPSGVPTPWPRTMPAAIPAPRTSAASPIPPCYRLSVRLRMSRHDRPCTRRKPARSRRRRPR